MEKLKRTRWLLLILVIVLIETINSSTCTRRCQSNKHRCLEEVEYGLKDKTFCVQKYSRCRTHCRPINRKNKCGRRYRRCLDDCVDMSDEGLVTTSCRNRCKYRYKKCRHKCTRHYKSKSKCKKCKRLYSICKRDADGDTEMLADCITTYHSCRQRFCFKHSCKGCKRLYVRCRVNSLGKSKCRRIYRQCRATYCHVTKTTVACVRRCHQRDHYCQAVCSDSSLDESHCISQCKHKCRKCRNHCRATRTRRRRRRRRHSCSYCTSHYRKPLCDCEHSDTPCIVKCKRKYRKCRQTYCHHHHHHLSCRRYKTQFVTCYRSCHHHSYCVKHCKHQTLGARWFKKAYRKCFKHCHHYSRCEKGCQKRFTICNNKNYNTHRLKCKQCIEGYVNQLDLCDKWDKHCEINAKRWYFNCDCRDYI